MVAPNIKKVSREFRPIVTPTAVADIVNILTKDNPGLSRSALDMMGKAVAVLSAVAAGLSPEQQRRIFDRQGELGKAVEDFVAEAVPPGGGRTLAAVNVDGPIETGTGAGLGALVDEAEGRRRLNDYATAPRIEDWAGPVAGPGRIERDFGTRRSTLHEWHKRGAVIGLLKGERKHVYPLAQFVDGRPVEGLAEIVKIIGAPRTAWLWLTRSQAAGGDASPLDHLKAGHRDEVIAAAERDFG